MQNTRDRILQFACQLFSKQGYNEVGIRDIAKKADVNPATVVYHFKSKADLYREVFHLAMKVESSLTIESILERDPDILKTPEGKSYAIQQIVLDLFHRNLHNPDSWRRKLVLQDVFEQNPVFTGLVKETLQAEAEKLERLFYMLCPEGSHEEAYFWTRLPNVHLFYYLVVGKVVAQSRGSDFSEALFRKVAKGTTELMILKLGLPVPDFLK